MKQILSSASKLVFVLVALGAVAGFFTGHLGEDNFMILAGSAFAFFFSYKGNPKEEYAGK